LQVFDINFYQTSGNYNCGFFADMGVRHAVIVFFGAYVNMVV